MTIQEIKTKIDKLFNLTGELIRISNLKFDKEGFETWHIAYKSPEGVLICNIEIGKIPGSMLTVAGQPGYFLCSKDSECPSSTKELINKCVFND